MLGELADEMQRIAAEEALAQVNVLQVGTGAAKPSRARRIIQKWKRTARKAPKRTMTPEQWRARLEATGIALKVLDARPRG